MVLRFNNYNNLVKTWRYSNLTEFEQTMLSISEISRIYSQRSLKQTLNVSHFISTQFRNIFVSHVSLLFQLLHHKYRKSYYFYFSSCSGCLVIIVCRMNYRIVLQNNNLEHLQAILH